jgi:hypothetical protein
VNLQGGFVMTWLRERLWMAAVAAVVVVGSLQRAPASGIPTTTPLFYAGTLEERGAPVTESRAFTLILWDSPTEIEAANRKCTTGPVTTEITAGRFRIALDGSCTDAVAASPDLFVEVIVGATSLGRKKLGAVPYAVEARGAVTAQTAQVAQVAMTAEGALAGQVVPAGMIAMFAGACPTGWVEHTQLRGRFPRGEDTGNVGSLDAAGSDDEVVVSHTHSVSGNTGTESANHTHGFSGNTVGESAPHSHGQVLVFPFGTCPAGQEVDANGGQGCPVVQGTSTGPNSTNHTHGFSGNTGGTSATHSHGFNVTSGNAAGGVAGTGANRPRFQEVIFCRKS